jgi:hypothetical protein
MLPSSLKNLHVDGVHRDKDSQHPRTSGSDHGRLKTIEGERKAGESVEDSRPQTWGPERQGRRKESPKDLRRSDRDNHRDIMPVVSEVVFAGALTFQNMSHKRFLSLLICVYSFQGIQYWRTILRAKWSLEIGSTRFHVMLLS